MFEEPVIANPRPADSADHPVLSALAPHPRDVAARLARAFAAAERELFFVGGIVRDHLLGRPLANELDFATSARPPETQRLGEAAGADAVYLVGERFGTVGLVFGREPERVDVEITTYRREHYPDQTRFPAVELGGRLEDDL